MKRYISGILASAALVVSGTAHAETYTSTATHSWSGVVLVQKTPSPAFPCTATVSGTPATTSGPLTNLTISFVQFGPTPPGLCESITVLDGPSGSPDLSSLYVWNTGPTQLAINGVYVHTPTPGDCSGNIVAAYDSSGNLNVNSSLPGGSGTDPCTFAGTLTQTSGGLVTNP